MSGQSDNIISDGELVIKRITEGITLDAGDIQIGSVELKDSDSAALANIKAANTARTTATVVVATQTVDAAGNVLGKTAANTARTTATLVDPVQIVNAAGAVDTIAVTNATASNLKTAATLDAETTKVIGTVNLSAAQTLATLTTLTGGGVAANAADSGNPIKVGGKYTAAGVTLDDGDRGDVALDSKSNINVNLNTLISGEDQTVGVIKVEQRFSNFNISTATTTTVKSAAGYVDEIICVGGTLGNVTIYDNTAGSGTVLLPTVTPVANGILIKHCTFSTGLTIVTAAATIITGSYR